MSALSKTLQQRRPQTRTRGAVQELFGSHHDICVSEGDIFCFISGSGKHDLMLLE